MIAQDTIAAQATARVAVALVLFEFQAVKPEQLPS